MMGTVNFNTRSGCTQNTLNRTASKYTLRIWLELAVPKTPLIELLQNTLYEYG